MCHGQTMTLPLPLRDWTAPMGFKFSSLQLRHADISIPSPSVAPNRQVEAGWEKKPSYPSSRKASQQPGQLTKQTVELTIQAMHLTSNFHPPSFVPLPPPTRPSPGHPTSAETAAWSAKDAAAAAPGEPHEMPPKVGGCPLVSLQNNRQGVTLPPKRSAPQVGPSLQPVHIHKSGPM